MNKVLLIVDMQKDFMDSEPRVVNKAVYPEPELLIEEYRPALPVPGALDIVPNIVREAFSGYDLIVATRDWHPQTHISFQEVGGDWPMHCIAGTEGAALLPEIDMVADVIVSKGTNPNAEAYSGFSGTPLEAIIKTAPQITEETDVTICGVATEYCVEATALDSMEIGFKTTVLLDCIAGVSEADSEDTLILLDEKGVTLRTRE